FGRASTTRVTASCTWACHAPFHRCYHSNLLGSLNASRRMGGQSAFLFLCPHRRVGSIEHDSSALAGSNWTKNCAKLAKRFLEGLACSRLYTLGLHFGEAHQRSASC